MTQQHLKNKIPLVSICCITYNHEQYIRDAIDGFLMQNTDFPFEICLGEDESNDGTREICQEYADKFPDKIRLFLRSRKDVIYINGQATGRYNFIETLKECKGKYIALCEGDDYWTDPYKLKKQVYYLEEDPEVGLVHSGADTYFVETNRRIRWIPKPINDDHDNNVFLKLLKSNYVIRTLTVVVRKDILLNVIRENPELYGEKYLFGDHQGWLLIALLSKVKFINESTATRNILEESATNSKNIDKVLKVAESVYQVKMDIWRKFGCSEEVALVIKKKHHENLLQIAFGAVNRKLAFDAFRKMKINGHHLTIKYCFMLLGASNSFLNITIKWFIRMRHKIKYSLNNLHYKATK